MEKPKPRTVNYALIPKGHEAYELLIEVREAWHDETRLARVALAWRNHTNADADGHLVLGKCIRVTDLNKEFSFCDFIIVLNREVWEDPRFTQERKAALLDHEMCHAAEALDKDGEPMIDERNRRVWRTRRHDIEEFRDVVARHGCYKADLEKFAEALLEKHANPLFDQETLPGMAKPDANSQGTLVEMKATQAETDALAGDSNPPADAPRKGKKSGPKDLAAYHAAQGDKSKRNLNRSVPGEQPVQYLAKIEAALEAQ